MTRLTCLLAALALILPTSGAMAQSGEFYGRTPIGPDFSQLRIRNSDGQRVTIHSRIDEIDGVYVICIASSGVANEDNAELMGYMQILLDGKIILRGADWAPHHRNVNGRQAVCRKTGARVVRNPSFSTEWSQYDF